MANQSIKTIKPVKHAHVFYCKLANKKGEIKIINGNFNFILVLF